MTALTAPRNTPERVGPIQAYPVKAGVILYQGGIAALDATGYAVPASTAANLVAIGRVEQTVDNSAGANGKATVEVRSGVFALANDTTNAVTQAHVGRPVKLLDDATASSASSGVAVGTCLALDGNIVWVKVGL